MKIELADQLITAARATAADEGVSVAIAVVDDSGNLVAFVRHTGVSFVSSHIAEGKAYTSAVMRQPTANLAAGFADKPAIVARLQQGAVNGTLTLMPGGLPVAVDGAVVGAIGVSGGTPDQDVAIATAAVSALG